VTQSYFSKTSEKEFWEKNKSRCIKISKFNLAFVMGKSSSYGVTIHNCTQWLYDQVGIEATEFMIEKPSYGRARPGFSPGHYNDVEFRFTPEAYSVVLISGVFDDSTKV